MFGGLDDKVKNQGWGRIWDSTGFMRRDTQTGQSMSVGSTKIANYEFGVICKLGGQDYELHERTGLKSFMGQL